MNAPEGTKLPSFSAAGGENVSTWPNIWLPGGTFGVLRAGGQATLRSAGGELTGGVGTLPAGGENQPAFVKHYTVRMPDTVSQECSLAEIMYCCKTYRRCHNLVLKHISTHFRGHLSAFFCLSYMSTHFSKLATPYGTLLFYIFFCGKLMSTHFQKYMPTHLKRVYTILF